MSPMWITIEQSMGWVSAIIKLVVGVPGIRNSKMLCRHVVPVKHWNFARNRKSIVKTLKTPCCGRNGIY